MIREGKTNRHDDNKGRKKKTKINHNRFFCSSMPIYCSTKESSSTIREIAIKKVVRHSIRKHPGSAVVAALQKAGFEYKEKDKHLSEEK